MRTNQFLIAINIVVLVAVLFDLCSRKSIVNNVDQKVSIVFAVRAVPEGKVIEEGDVDETLVSKNRIPSNLLSKEESYASGVQGPNEAWYPTTKYDVLGHMTCVSGINCGQILVHKYPGFRGVLLLEPPCGVPTSTSRNTLN